MIPLTRRWIAISTILFLKGAAAGAQERSGSAGWSLYPSFQIGAVYDDNIFFRRRTVEGTAVHSRMSAILDAMHQGRGSSFRGGYGVTGELFWGEREDLTRFPSSQRGSASMTTRLGSRSSLTAAGSYVVTRRPEEAFGEDEIELGRRRAEAYSASVGFSRRLAPRHDFGAQYSFGHRRLDARAIEAGRRLASNHHSVFTSWGHTYSASTSGSLGYAFRVFQNRPTQSLTFEESFESHVVTYGLTRQLGPRASMSFHGGPNFYEDLVLDPSRENVLGTEWRTTIEAGVSFRYGWRNVSLAVTYARSQRQFLGATGRVTTDRVGLSVGINPARRLSVGLSAGAQRNSQLGDTFETYRAGINATYSIAPWWSLRGEYGYSYQERFFRILGDELDPPGGRSRNRAFIGMVIGKTIPLE